MEGVHGERIGSAALRVGVREVPAQLAERGRRLACEVLAKDCADAIRSSVGTTIIVVQCDVRDVIPVLGEAAPVRRVGLREEVCRQVATLTSTVSALPFTSAVIRRSSQSRAAKPVPRRFAAPSCWLPSNVIVAWFG